MTARSGKNQQKKDRPVLVDDAGEIPTFASDEDELEYWRTHTPSDKFFARAEVLNLEQFLLREAGAEAVHSAEPSPDGPRRAP